MEDFPVLTGGHSELTAAALNSIIGQLRRQSRLVVSPPLEVRETPGGWLLSLNEVGGFWGRLADPSGDGTSGDVYDFVEVTPDADGAWQDRPSGRYGLARDANGRGGDVPGELTGQLVWLSPPPQGSTELPHTFQAAAAAPELPVLLFLARIDGESGGTYGYVEQVYDNGAFRDADGGRRCAVSLTESAREANGLTGVPDGTIVLMYQPASDLSGGDAANPELGSFSVGPTFAYASGDGFWAELDSVTSPQRSVLALDAVPDSEDSDTATAIAPSGGTWVLRAGATINGTTYLRETDALPYDAAALEVQEALEALSFITFGNVSVSGSAGGPWTLIFAGDLLGTAVSLLVLGESLEYAGADEAPSDAPTTPATGPYRDRVSLTTRATATTPWVSPTSSGWRELSRSASGSWYAARNGRLNADYPGEPLSYVGRGDVTAPDVVRGSRVFLERTPDDGDGFLWTYDHAAPPSAWVSPSGDGNARRGVRLELAGESANEIQVLELYDTGTILPGGLTRGRPASGTFTLSLGEEVSDPIAWNGVWQDVVDAVEKFTPVGAGNVLGEGGPLPLPVRLEFVGELAGNGIDLLTVDGSLLVGEEDADGNPLGVSCRVYREPLRRLSVSGWRTDNTDYQIRIALGAGITPIFDITSGTALFVQSALNKLTGISPFGVSVRGGYAASHVPGHPVIWDIHFRHRYAQEGVSVPSPTVLPVALGSVITHTVESTTSIGRTLDVAGTCRLGFGAQYRLDEPAGVIGSYTVTINGSTVFTVTPANPVLPTRVSVNLTLPDGGSGTGHVALWRRPGESSAWLCVTDWPEGVACVVAVNSSGLTWPTPLARSVVTTYLGERPGDGWRFELSLLGQVTGGTWRFVQLDFYDPITGATTASPTLNYNASAADVLAVLEGYRYRLANRFPASTGVWSSFDHYPFLGATTVGGGPLNVRPITILVDNAEDSSMRDYPPFWSVDYPGSLTGSSGSALTYLMASYGKYQVGAGLVAGSLSTDGTSLTGPSVPAVTLSRLDSAAIDLPGTVESLQEALDATGAPVVVSGSDGGPYDFAAPDYDGTDLSSGPFDTVFVSDVTLSCGTLRLLRDGADTDGLFAPGYSLSRVVNRGAAPRPGNVLRVDVQGLSEGCTRRGFWARTYGPYTQPSGGPGSVAPSYHWREVYPGDRLPRVSGLEPSGLDDAGQGTHESLLAQESAGNPDVPDGSLVWLEESAAYLAGGGALSFNYRVRSPESGVGAPARVAGAYSSTQVVYTGLSPVIQPVTGWVGGGSPAASALRGDLSTLAWGTADSWGNALLGADPADPLADHRGKVTLLPQAPTYVSGEPGFPDAYLPRVGSYVPALRDQQVGLSGAITTSWLVPVSVPSAARVRPGVIYARPEEYVLYGLRRLEGEGFLFPSSVTLPSQEFGDGDKSIDGALLLREVGFARGGTPIAFSYDAAYASDYIDFYRYQGYGYYAAINPGQSAIQSMRIDAVSDPDLSTGYSLSWSGYGSTGDFYQGISGEEFQQLLDDLFDGDCVMGREPYQDGSVYVYSWSFTGGLACRAMPTPTFTGFPTASFTITNPGLDPADAYDPGSTLTLGEVAAVWPAGYGDFSLNRRPDFTFCVLAVSGVWSAGGTFGINDTGVIYDMDGQPVPAQQRLFTTSQGFRHARGKGIHARSVTFFGGEGESLPDTQAAGGMTLYFEGGICHQAQSGGRVGDTFTFPTRDGRTVTVTNGYIVSVA